LLLDLIKLNKEFGSTGL